MIMTTTPTVEGREIDQYLDLVWSGRSHFGECIKKIAKKAEKLDADAVVGITTTAYDGGEGGDAGAIMLGTAVKLK